MAASASPDLFLTQFSRVGDPIWIYRSSQFAPALGPGRPRPRISSSPLRCEAPQEEARENNPPVARRASADVRPGQQARPAGSDGHNRLGETRARSPQRDRSRGRRQAATKMEGPPRTQRAPKPREVLLATPA